MRTYVEKDLNDFMNGKGFRRIWWKTITKYPTQNWKPKKQMSIMTKKIKKRKNNHNCFPSKEKCYRCNERKKRKS